MPLKPSALTEEQTQFCESIAEFCREKRISLGTLSTVCEGDRNGFSKSTAHSVVHRTIQPSALERLRPIIAAGLTRWLDDRGLHATEIESELSSIFDQKEFKTMLFNRCELDLPAQRFFGLSRDPFDVDHIPKPDEIFSTPELDDTVQRVKDAIIYQRFVAVIGDVGSGKTLLKMRVANELANEPSYRARLLYPEFYDMEQVNVGAIASYILTEFEQRVPTAKPVRVRKIKELLTDLYNDDVRPALILDECHRLNAKVISSLKNFWEMSNGQFSRLLAVVLYGQPAFVNARLRDIAFKEIRQRVQIIEMPSFAGAARSYVEHRIRLAGGNPDELFDPAALDAICRSASTPLAIGNLVNEALSEAYDLEERRVLPGFTFFKKIRDLNQVLGVRRSAA